MSYCAINPEVLLNKNHTAVSMSENFRALRHCTLTVGLDGDSDWTPIKVTKATERDDGRVDS